MLRVAGQLLQRAWQCGDGGGSSVAAELANALVDLLASVAAVLAFCAVVFAGAQTTDFLERQGRRVWKALRSLV